MHSEWPVRLSISRPRKQWWQKADNHRQYAHTYLRLSVWTVLLRGKHKATYTPHQDCGDHVIIINAEKAILTGAKAEQKYYRHHTGWVGGLKKVKYGILMDKNPEFAMELAVKGMLPNNSLGRNAFSRLRVFKGPEHNHQAQKPEVYEG